MFIFLGAGASRPFDIPTMPEFPKILYRELGKRLLYKKLMGALGADFHDLEIIMTILDDLSKYREPEFYETISPQTSRFLLKGGQADLRYIRNVKKEALHLLTEIKKIITRECMQAVRQGGSKIKQSYDDLFQSLHQAKDSITLGWNSTNSGTGFYYPIDLRIFTTNYDTCIEVYLKERQIPYTKGLIERYGEYVFDITSYNDGAGRVGIFKLHGSIDLFKKEDRIIHSTSAEGETTYLGEKYEEQFTRWPVEFGGYRQIIESPNLDLFRLLRDRADKEKWWIVIGSSLRDRTICSILNDIIRLKDKKERPNAFLVDPFPERIITRIQSKGYISLADAFYVVKVEFGSKDFATKLKEAIIAKASSKKDVTQ